MLRLLTTTSPTRSAAAGACASLTRVLVMPRRRTFCSSRWQLRARACLIPRAIRARGAACAILALPISPAFLPAILLPSHLLPLWAVPPLAHTTPALLCTHLIQREQKRSGTCLTCATAAI